MRVPGTTSGMRLGIGGNLVGGVRRAGGRGVDIEI